MLSLLALCLPAAAQTAQPDVTLTFPNISGANESTALTATTFKSTYKDASSFIGSISTITKVYATTAKGMKLGASGSAGTLKISLTPDYQRDIEKITLVGQLYNSSKAATVTINGVSSAGSLGGSESEISFTDFTSNVNGSSLTIVSSKYVCIRSISIYFKSDKQPVEQPVITCSDNKVAISCGTEGASIVYSTDGSEPSIPYTEPFSITETCTVKAKASKEGMVDSDVAEQECTFVPTTKPDGAVVMIGDQVAEDCETYEVAYGTEISISAKNATGLVVKNSVDNVEEEKENPYIFKVEKSADYDVTPYNDIDYAETFMFHLDIVAPEITLVKNGETGIADGSTVTVKKGTEILVEAFSASEVKVANASGDVTFADGKFAVSDEGEYTITAINPEHMDGVNFKFTVAYPEAPEYATLEEDFVTSVWEFVAIEGKDTAKDPANRVITTDPTTSAPGSWIASCSSTCYTASSSGIQLGSKSDNFADGKVILTTSEIPEDAIILSVSVTGKAASSGSSTWKLAVNDVDADNTISITSTSVATKTFDNVNLTGSKIVLAVTAIERAVYFESISVSYMVPAEPSAPEFDVPATIEHGSTIVYTVKYGKVHYHIEEAGAAKSPMMRVSEPTADWTVATENEGKQFTYEYVAGNNHNIYVKNVVNGKEVEGEAINVNASGTVTGVESVAAEGAEGARELYNLQGVRVSEAEAVPGVYVERRGGKVAKVVIR